MDSNASVVQNQVQGNDEHHPDNVESQQVVDSEEQQPHDKEVKSVFSKVKAKAKKIKDSIKKHGQNVLDHGHEHRNEDHHIPDETEGVRSGVPKVENLEKSEVNFEGTTVEGEETNQKARVVDVSPTTEQGKTFVGEEKSEQPNLYLERPIGLEEDPPKYNQTELKSTAEIDVDKSFERKNVQDEQENVTETKSPSAGTGSLNQFVPDLYTATKIEAEEPHQEPQVVDVNPTTDINRNIATDQTKTFVYEENLEEDSHGSGSRDEAYTPPKYHQTEDTDLTGAAGTEEIGNRAVELKHRPEPKVFGNVTETQYPPTATGSHNQLVREISTPTKTENPSAESHEYIPELSSEAKIQYPSAESHEYIPELSSEAKIQYPSAESHEYIPELSSEAKNQYPTAESHEYIPELSSAAKIQHPSAESHEYIPELSSAAKIQHPSAESHEYIPELSSAAKIQHPSAESHEYIPELSSAAKIQHPSAESHEYIPELSSAAKIQHPSAESHEYIPELSSAAKIQHPSAESHEYIPELSSAAKIQHPSAEIHHQFVQDFSTAAKTQDPSDGSRDQFDLETISTGTNRDHEISEANEQTLNNNNTIKVEDQPSYESVEKPLNVSNTDKTHKSGDAFNKSGSTAEYGENIDQPLTEKLGQDYGKVAEVGSAVKSKVSETGTSAETENEVEEEKKGVSSVKDYLADNLRPSEEDKAVSEVNSEALHKPKKDFEPDYKKTEKVSEESNVQSPGKGVVDKLKDVVGSWFGKTGENQSAQGDEGLSKNEKSGVEVEQVNKAED
ncbi:hypothetical protein Lal_00000448 [Lupinus albus]|uniref:Uncharacterized protein n=1 Tax=Lupinus albus TaxID=3870 RepID=A0A6A4NR51_LUPAL|nr:hypothetical protein Lalb_Chr21g0305031 [Lupinus albus]KAF1861031.1 hypothetical protein Lal_00000448 [Lupinus albus]